MGNLESASNLGLVVSEVLSGYRFTVYSGHGVHVEGHRGVLFFDDERVVLKQKKSTLKIEGEGLKIRELSDRDVYVSGKVFSLTLGEKTEKVNV